jgi:ParB/RepB/Spo0J family partition protein
MAVREIPLELVDDNPFMLRTHYKQAEVKELALSIWEIGLRQKPEGRELDGRVQLAYGGKRRRAFLSNQKKYPANVTTMPVDVHEISDQDMFHYAMAENLARSDVTPLEVARYIQQFSEQFPDVPDEEIARKQNMTPANVSNMKRVLRLPDKLLEKIEAGIINFTQGRELLILERVEDAEHLMISALGNLRTGNKSYGHPNTVEGLQASIHETISYRTQPLDKEFEGRHDILFDTRAAGCLQCEKMIRTHPTKSKAAHFCLDKECWDRHQEEHREKAAAEAKARMEADILRRAAVEEAPAPAAYTMEKRGTTWIAIDGAAVIIAIGYDKAKVKQEAEESFKPITTALNPSADNYRLNHTFRITAKPGVETHTLPSGEPIIDVTAQDLAAGIRAMDLQPEQIREIKVWKSSGKLGTGGGVSAGWSKYTGDISQEKLPAVRDMEAIADGLEALADERDRIFDEARERANLERPVGELPCDTCARSDTCDRANFYTAQDDSGRYVCDVWEPKELTEAPTQELPEDVLQKAREAAGTRAEVIDIHPLRVSPYHMELKDGYVLLNEVIDRMDNPNECLEECTHGFHYAFDSSRPDRAYLGVCSDPKCVSQKKSALTRKRNAEGQARRRAESKAVKEALANVAVIGPEEMKVILYAQIKGKHLASYYYGEQFKKPEKWLWDKVSAGTEESKRTTEALFKQLDKLSPVDLAKLLVEMMFYYIIDRGDAGSHEIRAELPLKWLGIKIEAEKPEKETPVAAV